MSLETPIAPEQPHAQQPQSNQLRFVLDVTLRHWVMIGTFTVVAAAVSATVGYLTQVERYEYRAVAELRVIPSLYETALMSNMGGSPFGRATPKTIKERTSSRGLAQDIVRALVQEDIAGGGELGQIATEKEYDAKAAELESRVTLEDRNDSGTLVITVRDDTHADAERLAEFASRALIEQSRHLLMDEQQETYELVRQQLETLRGQLDEAESRQWSFREEMGFRTHGQVWADMEKKNSELVNASTTREEINAKLDGIENALLQNSRDLPLALGNVSEHTVEKLILDLEGLIGTKAELLVDWLPGSPGLASIEGDIQSKRQAIQIAINDLDGDIGGGSTFWRKRQSLYQQKLEFELQLTSLDIRTTTLERILGEMVDHLPELADLSFEYEQLTHEAEQVRQQFNHMLEKEFEIKTALSRGSATVERRDAIVVFPTFSGTGSPVWASLLLGTLIGFIIGFALAMMLEMMDTSIQTIEDVSQYIDLEVIGMIPRMRFGKPSGSRRRRKAYVVSTDESQIDACIVTQHDPKSPISEAYRSLRTNFQFATIQEKPKTVMVTSAVPGEGKTTTAVNFAVTMADRGMRVLIVDTDLRRPNVHRVLKMERGPGLADVLRERIPIKNVVRPTRIENLWIVSSGRVPPNPSELIGSDRMRRLVGELGETFDLVVCDAPSILVVTDPVLLATHVNTVVLVVSVNYARRETVQRAKKLLETANPRTAGVVLNGLEATRRHYYYYYYYYDDANASPGRRRWYHRI